MMDIAVFFEPIDPGLLKIKEHPHPLVLGKSIHCHDAQNGFPDLESVHIALIGVNEDRGAMNQGSALAPDLVRKCLYKLFTGPFKLRIADLGNIRKGNQITDTYFAVKTVVSELIKNNITPVIIGGSQDITYANYLAYEELGQIINLVAVDPRFDIGINKDEAINNGNFLSHILTRSPNYLFNYANIGYQTYFVDQDAIELMRKLNFDAYRLGIIRKELEEAEPVVRNADMLSFDMSSIRQSDAPGCADASPNGFHGEEACQVIRYAGLSDKLTSIGFYNLNPGVDREEQTAHLLSQMIWYFFDGYYHRKQDLPDRKSKETNDFLKYVVSVKDFQQTIVFYKSKKSDRWWMEVPYPSGLHQKYERQFLVSCSYKDYTAACQNEMPEKWWQVYHKFL
jgi:formiminoglutamase